MSTLLWIPPAKEARLVGTMERACSVMAPALELSPQSGLLGPDAVVWRFSRAGTPLGLACTSVLRDRLEQVVAEHLVWSMGSSDIPKWLP